MEQILEDQEKKELLIHLNYYFSVLLRWLECLDNPRAMNLVAVALLLPLNNFDNIEMRCNNDDIYYAQPINKTPPAPCSMKIYDLLLRYVSLLTPTL
jgi:hypothetical protein